MKKVITLILATFFYTLAIHAQDNNCEVVFSKFKLDWFNIMGMRGGGNGQRLKLTFKNNSDKVLKYVNVHYWAINAVNDIETDQFGRKDFLVNCTGPFTQEKQNKLEVQIALFHPNLLIAYPYKIEIIYMNGNEKEIEINRNNINTIFPCIKYINVGNMESSELATNNNNLLGEVDGIQCKIIERQNNGIKISTTKELTPDQIRKAKELFSLKSKVMFNLAGSEEKGEAYAGIDEGFIILYKTNEFLKL